MARTLFLSVLGLALVLSAGCSEKQPPAAARQTSAAGDEGTKTETADYNTPVAESPRRSSAWQTPQLAEGTPSEAVENPAPSGGGSLLQADITTPQLIGGNERRSSTFLPTEPELPSPPSPPPPPPAPSVATTPAVTPEPDDELAVRGGGQAMPSQPRLTLELGKRQDPPQITPNSRLTLRSEVGSDLPPEPTLEDEPVPVPPPAPVPAPATASAPPRASPQLPRFKIEPASPSSIDMAKSVPLSPRHPVRAQGSSSKGSNEIIPLIPSAAERMGNKDHEVVEVFYATDRKPIHEGAELPQTVLWRFCPIIMLAMGTILCLGLALQRPAVGIWFAAITLGIITAVWTYVAGTVTANNARYLAKQGPRYGTERGELKLGVCRVSIPRVHQVGALEAPSILKLELKEDVRKHVVLDGVYPMQDENYYARMKSRVSNSERRELFIFIHGYNVTFEDAARRTAQMHYDLDYQGAPIFYSWPSQGELLKYTVDETNIAWTTPHFKDFIRDVAAKSDARSINLIAHSMGNRALTGALKELAMELQKDQRLFNQVVLAAPDIDAEIFKRDIAPAIQRTCANVTLYASSQDQALVASKLVHGFPRAGESGPNLVVLEGIDTIDVSAIETNFLGHSYYGDSDVILADICNLLTESKPPANRGWLTAAHAGKMTYWVFQGARAATHMPRTMRR